MPPLSFVFERLIEEVERRVNNAVAQGEIEIDPARGPAIVGRVVSEVFGEPSTREALVIMSSISNVDEYLIDTRGFDTENEVSMILKACLDTLVDQRLSVLKNGVAAISFAAGFAPVAEKLVALAEHAIETFPSSKWVDGQVVVEARTALERVLDKNGSEADLETVLRSTEILRVLLMAPKDKVAWQRHGLDYDAVLDATRALKPYKDMLGLGWNILPDALTAISNRHETELRPGASAASPAASAPSP